MGFRAEAVSARRRFRITVAVVTACALIPLAYSVLQHVTHGPVSPAGPPSAPGSRSAAPYRMALQVMPAPYQLPAAVSREVR